MCNRTPPWHVKSCDVQLATLNMRVAFGCDHPNMGMQTIIETGEKARTNTILVQPYEGDPGTMDFTLKMGQLAPILWGRFRPNAEAIPLRSLKRYPF